MRGSPIFDGSLSLDDTIESWFTCIRSNWKKVVIKKSIDKNQLFELVKIKANQAIKRGEFSFKFLYELESEIKEVFGEDSIVKEYELNKSESRTPKNKLEKPQKRIWINNIMFIKTKDLFKYLQLELNIPLETAKTKYYRALRTNKPIVEKHTQKKYFVKKEF